MGKGREKKKNEVVLVAAKHNSTVRSVLAVEKREEMRNNCRYRRTRMNNVPLPVAAKPIIFALTSDYVIIIIIERGAGQKNKCDQLNHLTGRQVGSLPGPNSRARRTDD